MVDVWDIELEGDGAGNADYGGKLRLTNSRFGQNVCLDLHSEDGTVGAFPCDNHGGDLWYYDSYNYAESSSLDEAMYDEESAGNATGRSLDALWISDGAELRFWNTRFGSKACLDQGPNKNHVGAYPCDNHGGNPWTIECPGDMADPHYGVCERVRLTNSRFGQKVCLDHHKPNEVDAFPCTGHGGDVWDLEFTGDGSPDYGGNVRLTNSRFGQTVCLDHHSKDGTVAAYPCSNHGGDDWFYDSYSK